MVVNAKSVEPPTLQRSCHSKAQDPASKIAQPPEIAAQDLRAARAFYVDSSERLCGWGVWLIQRREEETIDAGICYK
jgi:hypothetical protein